MYYLFSSLLSIGLFIFSISSFFGLGRLYISRNLSVSYMLSVSLADHHGFKGRCGWPPVWLVSRPCIALGLGVCEILCVPSKSGISISYSPLALLKVCPTGLQSQIFWGLIFPVHSSQGWGDQCGAQTPPSLGTTSIIVIILLFVGLPPRSMGLDCTVSSPLLPIFLWFFLYIFSCRQSFLLVFRSSHPYLLCK